MLGKGYLDVVCVWGGGGDDGDCFESLTSLGVQYFPGYEAFKKYYTADGDCEMRTSRFGSIEIKEDLKAGRGQKTIVFEYYNPYKLLEKGPSVYCHVQLRGKKGEIIRKGSIIDCEKARIRHPDEGMGIPFYH
jgi:hypothetical protein